MVQYTKSKGIAFLHAKVSQDGARMTMTSQLFRFHILNFNLASTMFQMEQNFAGFNSK